MSEWVEREVCRDCGWHDYPPASVCQGCGRNLGDDFLRFRNRRRVGRWVSDGVWWKPSTWGTGHWEWRQAA